MTTAASDVLERVIRNAGEDYLIDWFAPKSEALPHLRELLRKTDEDARERLGNDAPRFTPEHLAEEFVQNPHHVKAFLQVLSRATPPMLLMTWRIIKGLPIIRIEMRYDSGATEPFLLRVHLESRDQDNPDVYESHDISDAVVLRHLGIVKWDGGSGFDGFYALNLERLK